MRVLVLHAGLHLRDVEHLEVHETVTGLVLAAQGTGLVVEATDGHRLYGTRLVDGELEHVDPRPLRGLLTTRYDVVHVHMVLPVWQLLAAAALRLRGAHVVITPMSMLGRDFAQASWFRQSGALRRRVKPLVVALLARAWFVLSDARVVASTNEAEQAGWPAAACSLLPLPSPRTGLAAAAGGGPAEPVGPGSPVALVSRWDPERKGFDRLCAWLETHADGARRPAAVLFAPEEQEGALPDRLRALVAQGVLVWDPSTRGSDLAVRLRSARAVLLLSRWEGQPRVLREASLLGLPTVSTTASNYTEVVAALGSGAVVTDPDDPASVQDAVDAVLSSPRGAERAARLFDRVEVGRTLLEVLERVAAGQRAVAVDHYRRLAAERPQPSG